MYYSVFVDRSSRDYYSIKNCNMESTKISTSSSPQSKMCTYKLAKGFIYVLEGGGGQGTAELEEEKSKNCLVVGDGGSSL